VLGGHEILLDAYRTDVRPLCAKVRADLGPQRTRSGRYAIRGI
jgi:L-rhamnose isomerase